MRTKDQEYVCMLMPFERECEIDKMTPPNTEGMTGKKLYATLSWFERKKEKWRKENCAKCGWEYSEDERRRKERHNGQA